ncbi:MAG TPA: hypothetical protein VFK62_07625 [Gaiellaceae bacterium]|nr:hypothetical protein [Gaiellaceae bacterium]
MPPQDDSVTESASSASSLGTPLLAVGAFAAGAAATLLATRLVDARRKTAGASEEIAGGADGSKEDLAAVLRRAALDVAVVASGQAADRLRSRGDDAESEPKAEAASGERR